MSLFADYLKEREGFDTLENDVGFATYKITGDECYLRDIYVMPEHRKDHAATNIANKVAYLAKMAGCRWLTGSVHPEANNADTSRKVLLAYGMKHYDNRNGLEMFVKEI